MPEPPTQPYGPRRPAGESATSDVERLLAYEEIRQLAARYALAMDSRDLVCLAELFVDDYASWSGRVGRHALREDFEAALRAGKGGHVGFTQIGTHVINLVDADQAYGTVYPSMPVKPHGRHPVVVVVPDVPKGECRRTAVVVPMGEERGRIAPVPPLNRREVAPPVPVEIDLIARAVTWSASNVDVTTVAPVVGVLPQGQRESRTRRCGLVCRHLGGLPVSSGPALSLRQRTRR